MDHITKNSLIVAPLGGGVVSLVDRQTGELLGAIPLMAGPVPPQSLLPFQTDNVGLEFGDGVWVTEKYQCINMVFSDAHGDTAAVPDYVPSAAATQARLFEQQLVLDRAQRVRDMAQLRAEMMSEASRIAETMVAERTAETADVHADDAQP